MHSYSPIHSCTTALQYNIKFKTLHYSECLITCPICSHSEVSAAAAPPPYPLAPHCYQNQKMVEQNTQSNQSIEVSQCIQVFAHCPLVLSSSVVLI